MSRRKLITSIGSIQSALSTTRAESSPQSKSRNRLARSRIFATKRLTSSRVSARVQTTCLRVTNQAVAPPTNKIGRWPASWNRLSASSGTRLPMKPWQSDQTRNRDYVAPKDELLAPFHYWSEPLTRGLLAHQLNCSLPSVSYDCSGACGDCARRSVVLEVPIIPKPPFTSGKWSNGTVGCYENSPALLFSTQILQTSSATKLILIRSLTKGQSALLSPSYVQTLSSFSCANHRCPDGPGLGHPLLLASP